MNRRGYRGYIASRLVQDQHVPQRVQNLVVRDYAQRNGLEYKLSAVEYVMPGCYMMLESVLDELSQLQGVIAFSIFMMPVSKKRRESIVQRILETRSSLHFALENLAIGTAADVARCEDLLAVARTLPQSLWEANYHRFSADRHFP